MKRHCFFMWIFMFVSLWSVACQQTPLTEPAPTAASAGSVQAVPQPTATPTSQPTPRPTVTLAYTPTFETAVCQFPLPPNEKIQCGYLTVPEDRANPQHTIRLHVAIVASHSDTPASDPLIFLNGGPGAYTLEITGLLIAYAIDILAERDLILFDQRGVGYSEPSLNCPESEEAWLNNIEKSLDDDEWLAVKLAALTACHDRLVAKGINLSAYNSAASAADAEDLRQALGYESWNLFGVSYGTRLALTIMRDFGYTGAIRSVILDSVYPPQANDFTDMTANDDHALNLLFNRCAENAQCNSAYPNLKARFFQLVDAWNTEPITITISDRTTLIAYHRPFNGDDLLEAVLGMMYEEDYIMYLPQMISQLEGEFGYSSTLADYLTESVNTQDHFSEGMESSVQCVEEVPFATVAEFQEKAEALPPSLVHFHKTYMTDALAYCDVWNVEKASSLENEPVRSDIPTLILVGDYDPVTPPSYAQDTAVYLPNAYYFEFEGIGHGVVNSTPCGIDLMTQFLDHPQAPPDATCMEYLYHGFVVP